MFYPLPKFMSVDGNRVEKSSSPKRRNFTFFHTRLREKQPYTLPHLRRADMKTKGGIEIEYGQTLKVCPYRVVTGTDSRYSRALELETLDRRAERCCKLLEKKTNRRPRSKRKSGPHAMFAATTARLLLTLAAVDLTGNEEEVTANTRETPGNVAAGIHQEL